MDKEAGSSHAIVASLLEEGGDKKRRRSTHADYYADSSSDFSIGTGQNKIRQLKTTIKEALGTVSSGDASAVLQDIVNGPFGKSLSILPQSSVESTKAGIFDRMIRQCTVLAEKASSLMPEVKRFMHSLNFLLSAEPKQLLLPSSSSSASTTAEPNNSATFKVLRMFPYSITQNSLRTATTLKQNQGTTILTELMPKKKLSARATTERSIELVTVLLRFYSRESSTSRDHARERERSVASSTKNVNKHLILTRSVSDLFSIWEDIFVDLSELFPSEVSPDGTSKFYEIIKGSGFQGMSIVNFCCPVCREFDKLLEKM